MFDLEKFQKLEELSGKLEKLLCEFEALCSNDETSEDEEYARLVWDLSQAWVRLDIFAYDRQERLTKNDKIEIRNLLYYRKRLRNFLTKEE